jgi:acyl carrier protein
MTSNSSAKQPALIEDTVIGLLSKVLYVDSQDIDQDQPLTEAGLDSILAVEFVGMVQAELGLSLTVATLYEHETPRKLASFVAQHRD